MFKKVWLKVSYSVHSQTSFIIQPLAKWLLFWSKNDFFFLIARPVFYQWIYGENIKLPNIHSNSVPACSWTGHGVSWSLSQQRERVFAANAICRICCKNVKKKKKVVLNNNYRCCRSTEACCFESFLCHQCSQVSNPTGKLSSAPPHLSCERSDSFLLFRGSDWLPVHLCTADSASPPLIWLQDNLRPPVLIPLAQVCHFPASSAAICSAKYLSWSYPPGHLSL